MAVRWPSQLRTLSLPIPTRAAGGARVFFAVPTESAVTTYARALQSRGRHRQLRITTCATDRALLGLLMHGPALSH